MKPPASIRRRLTRTLLAWSLVWSVAVASAVWLAAWHEVEELLDDSLRASAGLLATLLVTPTAEMHDIVHAPLPPEHDERFAWQLVDHDGRLLLRSSHAPATPWDPTPSPGFHDADDWRVFGFSMGQDGRMLYTAQTGDERREAHAAVAVSAVLATLAIAFLGQVWLRSRVRHELEPLQRLSERLSTHDPGALGASLGAADRRELEPVHAAIDELARRLTQRVDNERAFAAHAAHALRTPLAGIDAQLAVALRDAPEPLKPRLQRAREAASRLQHVVTALLGLFRSATVPQRGPVDVSALIARLPAERLQVDAPPGMVLDADPDLLAAALANLFDNAQRHGAHRVVVSLPAADCLRLDDDGPGVSPATREALQEALEAQRHEASHGLGLMLADRVARSHGGVLRLPAVDRGFAVEMTLPPARR